MKHITIIGCGLIGGSFAALIKKYKPEITICGIGQRKDPLLEATKKGLINTYQTTIDSKTIEKTDLIILSTPISSILPIIQKLSKEVTTSKIIIDFSSVKSFLNNPIVTESHHSIIVKNIKF